MLRLTHSFPVCLFHTDDELRSCCREYGGRSVTSTIRGSSSAISSPYLLTDLGVLTIVRPNIAVGMDRGRRCCGAESHSVSPSLHPGGYARWSQCFYDVSTKLLRIERLSPDSLTIGRVATSPDSLTIGRVATNFTPFCHLTDTGATCQISLAMDDAGTVYAIKRLPAGRMQRHAVQEACAVYTAFGAAMSLYTAFSIHNPSLLPGDDSQANAWTPEHRASTFVCVQPDLY